MKAALQKDPFDQIAEFGALVHEGLRAWEQAGKILVDLLDGGQVTRAVILERCEGLSAKVLERFELLGRRLMHPKLLLHAGAPAAGVIKKLSYPEQGKLMDAEITVLRGHGTGSEVKVRVQDLTTIEVGVVFDENGKVRPVEAQRQVWRRRGGGYGKGTPRTERTYSHGRMDGHDPDGEAERKQKREAFEALAEATPLDLLKTALTNAHTALIEARRHLATIEQESKWDDLITHALSPVGRLRHAAGSGEIAPPVGKNQPGKRK